jgi:hypothetical protein
VTINDSDEQDWLVSKFGGSDQYWIGFYQLPESVEPDQGWVWISGESVTFTNWAKFDGTDEPNDLFGNESVAAMNEHLPGLWNDLPATSDYRRIGIIEVASVPLPSALLLLGSGLFRLGLFGWRREGSYLSLRKPEARLSLSHLA